MLRPPRRAPALPCGGMKVCLTSGHCDNLVAPPHMNIGSMFSRGGVLHRTPPRAWPPPRSSPVVSPSLTLHEEPLSWLCIIICTIQSFSELVNLGGAADHGLLAEPKDNDLVLIPAAFPALRSCYRSHGPEWPRLWLQAGWGEQLGSNGAVSSGTNVWSTPIQKDVVKMMCNEKDNCRLSLSYLITTATRKH